MSTDLSIAESAAPNKFEELETLEHFIGSVSLTSGESINHWIIINPINLNDADGWCHLSDA